MKIRGLGYIGFGALDPEQWLEFGTKIIGAMPSRALPGESWGTPMDPTSSPASKGKGVGTDGSVYLKFDDYQWRIAIHPHATKRDILYIGFELASGEDIEEAVLELQQSGFEARMGSEEEARSRSVTGIAFTKDPNGNNIELFYGPCKDFKFQSPVGAQFKMGSLGLGHMNLFVSDLIEVGAFYNQTLGFKLSDYIMFAPGLSANFFHCNARHHTLGLTRVGDINGLHHIMFELENSDMVGQCLDRAMAAGIPITSTLGRHTNDRMLSFYMSSPFGFEVEIGCEGLLVDEQWLPSEFCEGDVWGHKGLDPSTITDTAKKITQHQK
jgi:3,4-dihydroxy-9,10-secoandrosta-1,3,5(10)-triene-9,17-dione 4,5-dioxygenase